MYSNPFRDSNVPRNSETKFTSSPLDLAKQFASAVKFGWQHKAAAGQVLYDNSRTIHHFNKFKNAISKLDNPSLINTMSMTQNASYSTPQSKSKAAKRIQSAARKYLHGNLRIKQGGAGGRIRSISRNFRSGSRSRTPGLRSAVRMSSKKIKKYARGNSIKPRLRELIDTLEPKVSLEEHFTNNAGTIADPLTNGAVGLKIQQRMEPLSVTNVFPGPNTLGSQLVEECCQYPYTEQIKLIRASQQKYAVNTHAAGSSIPMNTGTEVDTIWNENFHFNFGGAKTIHTFVNTGVTQCEFELIEWKPRRHLVAALTPLQLWNRDLKGESNAGYGGNTQIPVHYWTSVTNPSDDLTNWDPRVMGQRPSRRKCPSLYYAYTALSTRKFKLQPGEECKYTQIFPPYVMKSEFMRVSGAITGITAVTEYNPHTRWLMFIGNGEKGVFSTAIASIMSNQSWQVGHQAVRYSSFRGSIPGKKFQRVVVDNDKNNIDFITESDMNEENDNITGVAGFTSFQLR